MDVFVFFLLFSYFCLSVFLFVFCLTEWNFEYYNKNRTPWDVGEIYVKDVLITIAFLPSVILALFGFLVGMGIYKFWKGMKGAGVSKFLNKKIWEKKK